MHKINPAIKVTAWAVLPKIWRCPHLVLQQDNAPKRSTAATAKFLRTNNFHGPPWGLTSIPLNTYGSCPMEVEQFFSTTKNRAWTGRSRGANIHRNQDSKRQSPCMLHACKMLSRCWRQRMSYTLLFFCNFKFINTNTNVNSLRRRHNILIELKICNLRFLYCAVYVHYITIILFYFHFYWMAREMRSMRKDTFLISISYIQVRARKIILKVSLIKPLQRWVIYTTSYTSNYAILPRNLDRAIGQFKNLWNWWNAFFELLKFAYFMKITISLHMDSTRIYMSKIM